MCVQRRLRVPEGRGVVAGQNAIDGSSYRRIEKKWEKNSPNCSSCAFYERHRSRWEKLWFAALNSQDPPRLARHGTAARYYLWLAFDATLVDLAWRSAAPPKALDPPRPDAPRHAPPRPAAPWAGRPVIKPHLTIRGAFESVFRYRTAIYLLLQARPGSARPAPQQVRYWPLGREGCSAPHWIRSMGVEGAPRRSVACASPVHCAHHCTWR